MALIDIPLPALRVCSVVFYLLCLAALFCVALAARLPCAKTVFVCGLITWVLTFPVTTFLAVYFVRLLFDRSTEGQIRFFLSLPVWMIGLLAVLSSVAVVLMLLRLRRLRKEALTAQSLCEGLDQLPDGVCYSSPDGFPIMVNSRMQAISNTAFGKGVSDTRNLDAKLKAHDVLPGCTVDEEANNIFLRLSDGTAWRMKQQQVKHGGRPMVEMLAYDVTERYNDLLELRRRNERLEKVNRELRSYLNNMERVVREREVLAAKTRLHNEIGQSLLAIEAYLAESGGDRAALERRLTGSILLLFRDMPDEHTDDRMYALFDAAKAVGVEICIDGEIPKNWKEIIEVAINECLTNTVKHADGHRLFVRIRNTDGKVVVQLTNDGKPPIGTIRETGGLSNLRALTEQQGGEIAVESAPVFRLTLRFDQEGNYIHGFGKFLGE